MVTTMISGDGRQGEGTILPPERIKFLAKVAKFCVQQGASHDNAARQMVAVGIRQLHDNARSCRGTGKYLGHSAWSVAAEDIVEANGGRVHGVTTQLSHEHAFPVMLVVASLFMLPASASLRRFEDIIRTRSVVAILTRDEDAMLRAAGLQTHMPDDWDGKDVWARLKAVGLYERLRWCPPTN